MSEGGKHKRPKTLFGRIAMELGFINAQQLVECLRMQEESDHQKRLGEIMLEKGYISVEQLSEILQVQQQSLAGDMRHAEEHLFDTVMGRLAIKKGYATEEQVNKALRIQATREERGIFCRLGEILVEKGFMTVQQVIEILKMQQKELMVCPECDRRFNVHCYNPGKSYFCKYCKVELQLPGELKDTRADTTIFLDLDKEQP